MQRAVNSTSFVPQQSFVDEMNSTISSLKSEIKNLEDRENEALVKKEQLDSKKANYEQSLTSHQTNIKDLKYKHEMRINFNMAIGFFKKFFILILIEEDMDLREKLMDKLEEKIEKYLEPVRPRRKYPRNKDKKNKYPINKRKSF